MGIKSLEFALNTGGLPILRMSNLAFKSSSFCEEDSRPTLKGGGFL